MPNYAVFTAGLLVLLGVGTWWGTGGTHGTALIPAYFGAGLALAGFVAMRPGLRKHAMHAAAMIALLGVIGAGWRAVPKAVEGALNTAVYAQLAMMTICLAFVIACVNSFIAARRAAAKA